MEWEFETILGIVILLIGIGAFAFILNARTKFPEGSELRDIAGSFIPVVIFLLLFSSWHTVREAFHWKKTFGEAIEYPEYLFISLAYIMLFFAARKIYNMAKKYGITK
jgi:hypothetical protein